MRRILALDIGTRNVKAALIEDTGKGFRALRLESVRRDQWLLTGPRAFLRQSGLPSSAVVATFPSSLCSFRDITIPSSDRTRLDEAAKYACEKLLPDPIEDLVVSCEPVARSDSETAVLAAAAQKTEIQRVIAPLQADQIELIALIPDAAAILSLVPFASTAPDCPAAILDIGSSSSKLVISQEGISPFLKAIRIGSDSLAPGESEPLTHHEESNDLEGAARSLGPAVEKLAGELARSFVLAPAGHKPDRLWLCGGGALLPDLPLQLSAKLELPVGVADPLAWIGSGTQDAEAAVFAAAIGAAVAAFRRKRPPLDLLKEEFRPRARVEKLAAPLATTLALIALTLVVLFTSRLAHNSRLSAKLDDVLDQQRAIGLQTLGAEITGGALSARLESKLKEFQRTAHDRTPVRGVSALSTLRHLAELVPKDGAVTIRSLNITQTGVTANMVARSRSDIDHLRDAIDASGLLIASVGETVKKGSEVTFTLDAKYGEPE